ncbi:hypothetical protein TeGR_g833 [Tetraparma gracilis]|uniref:Uncharacterized protein n=1 Tax=Tetraparma gracilis TaxID=2962635 RepID=A0ABQ6N4R2_9STRA|nr:hypothetical protein TeGR_g833 [Tetraparma gracilis]
MLPRAPSSLLSTAFGGAADPAAEQTLPPDNSATALSRPTFKGSSSNPDDSTTSGDWEELPLHPDLLPALASLHLPSPTPVQSLAIPPLSSGASLAFAAATGSGKTLAFLLPLFHRLKTSELPRADPGFSPPKPGRPRALVLAPTRELAEQIFAVVKSLSHHCRLSSALVVGGADYGVQRRGLGRAVDVLVGTPGRVLKHKLERNVALGSVQVVVVDETDTMLESGFAGDMAKLIHPLLYEPASNDEALRPTAPQFVMTTATLTPGVRRLLDPSSSPLRPGKAPPAFKLPPSLRTLAATGLHRVVPRLRQTFVDVGSHDKLSLLADVVSTGSRGAAPEARADPGAAEPLTVVFCNTVQSCRAAEHALAEGGIESECYHGDLNSKARSENLGRFRED